MYDLKYDLKFRESHGLPWPPDKAELLPKPYEPVLAIRSADGCVFGDPLIACADLHDVVGSLLLNVERVLVLLSAPTNIAFQAREVEFAARLAGEQVAGVEPADKPFWSTSDKARLQTLAAAAQTKFNQMMRNPDLASEQALSLNEKLGVMLNRPYATWEHEIDVASKGGMFSLKLSLLVILQSATQFAYTAFESCATDLWVRAVNLRPETLGRNVVMEKTTAKDHGYTDGQSKQQEPRIRFTDLADFNFNISGSLGTLLRETNRVRFDCLRNLCTAYRDAFRVPNARTSESLNELFDRYMTDLRCLEAVRNLLAHRGGIVDDRFIAEVTGHSVELAALPLREPIPIDGPMVSKFVSAAGRASVDLLNFVAGWLSPRDSA